MAALDRLKELRTSGERQSKEVVEIAEKNFSDITKLGDERKIAVRCEKMLYFYHAVYAS